MTKNEIERGYWYYTPSNNFPPPAKLLSEHNSGEKLNLIITRGNEPDSQVRKRERTYPNAIPDKLWGVKVLWANHINQETLNSICQCDQINSLYINSSRIKDIGGIKQLKNLSHLAMLNMTKVESISVLNELTNLQSLKIEHFKRISDFTVLSDLTKLEGLQIDGDMYTAQKIVDFEFLTNLSRLKYLTLTNTRATVKNMDPILKLKDLEMFQCSANYPKYEFRKLRSLENLKYIGGNIEKYIKNES